jgi:hypothetical protein
VVRSPKGLVLDPGCGGFLLVAYRELVRFKTGRYAIPPLKGVHEKVIAQLYGVDINAFPAHLTAVNFAMKGVRSPFTGLNVIEHDFFQVEPKARMLTSYTVRTTTRIELRRGMEIPVFDVIIGNPPRVRWVEVLNPTQNAIKARLKDRMRKYGLTTPAR